MFQAGALIFSSSNDPKTTLGRILIDAHGADDATDPSSRFATSRETSASFNGFGKLVQVLDGEVFDGEADAELTRSCFHRERQYARDTDDREVVVRELLRLTARVTGRMRVAGVAGRTVTITVRFADFTTITRSRTLPEATDVTQEIYRTATRLYDALGLQRARLRLVGVRVEGLVPRGTVQRQLLLGERERGWADADRAVDRATLRFGAAALRPASLLS